MGKLGLLNDWIGKAGGYIAKRSAQSFLSGAHIALAVAGSACGTGDDGKKNPSPKPAACGSACGAGDDGKKKPEPKPSACGAGDK